VAGLWARLRRPQWAPIRFLPVGDGVLLILLALTAGKGYYAAGMFGHPSRDAWAITPVGRTQSRRRL
jgi:hypothetical protein